MVAQDWLFAGADSWCVHSFPLLLKRQCCKNAVSSSGSSSAKADSERSAMLGQLLDLREERGMAKKHIRELERQLHEAKKQEQESHHGNFASGAVSSE